MHFNENKIVICARPPPCPLYICNFPGAQEVWYKNLLPNLSSKPMADSFFFISIVNYTVTIDQLIEWII